jgi:cell division septation protein DedD
MAENRKGSGEGLYYLRRGQLAILGGGFVITSVIVFFLGILIGQRIEERKLLKKEEPTVKIPVRPLTPGPGTASKKEDLTFYDTLAKAPSGSQTIPGTTVKGIKPLEGKTKPTTKETKPVAKAETQKVKEKEVKQERKTEKPAAKEVKIIAKGDAVQSPQKVKEKLGVEKAAQPKTPVVAAAKDAKATKKGGWAVQVNAFPNEKDAMSLTKKLADKGYDAYMVSADIRGRTWYRVRVGRLASRDEAKGLLETLKTKEKFTKAITVSP